MANRRLYGERSFVVYEIIDYDRATGTWHVLGSFTEGSIKSLNPKKYRIRVKADPRWKEGVHKIWFHADRVWESESVARQTRRHVYGSGHWYVSPFRPEGVESFEVDGEFAFDDFDTTPVPSPRKLAVKSAQAEEEAERKKEAKRLRDETKDERKAERAQKKAEREKRLEAALKLAFVKGWNRKHQREQWESRCEGILYVLDRYQEYFPSWGPITVESVRDLVPGRVVLVRRIVI